MTDARCRLRSPNRSAAESTALERTGPASGRWRSAGRIGTVITCKNMSDYLQLQYSRIGRMTARIVGCFRSSETPMPLILAIIRPIQMNVNAITIELVDAASDAVVRDLAAL